MLFAFLGPQVSCFPPSNFTAKQAAYVDTYCWDSLMHHEFDANGNSEERSLWVHKVWLCYTSCYQKKKQCYKCILDHLLSDCFLNPG